MYSAEEANADAFLDREHGGSPAATARDPGSGSSQVAGQAAAIGA
jgi:hypothetical protein